MNNPWPHEEQQYKRSRTDPAPSYQHDAPPDSWSINQSFNPPLNPSHQQSQYSDYSNEDQSYLARQYPSLAALYNQSIDHQHPNPTQSLQNPSLQSHFNPSLNHQHGSSLNPSLNHSLNQSMHQSMNHSINPSLNQSLSRLMNHSMNPSLSQSMSHSLNQSMNQGRSSSLNHSNAAAFAQSLSSLTSGSHFNPALAQSLGQLTQSLSQSMNPYSSTSNDGLNVPLLDERFLAPFVNQSVGQSFNQSLNVNSTSPAMNMQQAAEAFFATRPNGMSQLAQPVTTLAQAINPPPHQPPPQNQAQQLSPTHSNNNNQTTVSETVTLSTLTCLIEKQYTIRKTESDRMTEGERKQLVQVNVRILKEKASPSTPSQRVTGVKRERDSDSGISPQQHGQSPVVCPAIYIPATDIGPLLNIRKNNIPGYISKYDTSLRQQMMVDCPRAAGGVARVQLNVLTLAGAEKFIVTSRSKQAEKVWQWIEQHVNKVKEREVQNLLNQASGEDSNHTQSDRLSEAGNEEDGEESFASPVLELKDGGSLKSEEL